MSSPLAQRSTSKRVVDLLIFLGCITGLGWYLSGSPEEFSRLSGLRARDLVLLSGLMLLGHFLVATKLRLSVGLFGSRLSLTEAFLLVETGSFINLVPLNLGTPFRAIYLKRAARLKYVDYGLTFVLTQFTGFLAAGALGLVFLSRATGASPALYALFAGYGFVPIGILGAAYLLRSFPIKDTLGKAGVFRKSLLDGVRTISQHPGVVVAWFLLDLGTNLTLGVRFWMLGRVLGYDIEFAAAMIMQAVTRLSALFTIIPSGTIGIREGLTGLGSTGLGKAAIVGMMIATVDRVIVTFWIGAMGILGIIVLRHRYESAGGRAESASGSDR